MFINSFNSNYGYTPEWCYEEYDIEPYKGYRITRQFQRPCSLYANRNVYSAYNKDNHYLFSTISLEELKEWIDEEIEENSL